MTTTCRCVAVAARKFASLRDGIADGRTKLLVDPVELTRRDDARLVLYRCACGRAWAESFWSVGHMDVDYVFPVPDGVDALVWFASADGLPFDHAGPLGRA